jgi:hypothetical protein
LQHAHDYTEQNIWVGRFLQLPLETLRRMHLELHIATAKTGSDRGGDKVEACELATMLLTDHRNADSGKPEEIALDALLPNEEARQVCL